MKIRHRLYLTGVPSVVGVLAVAGLAYWGRYAHAIPELLLGIAILAAFASAVLSWQNARCVARRIEHFAGASTSSNDGARPFKGVLRAAAEEPEVARPRSQRDADRRLTDYAAMLATVAADSAARLEEVRLPLHILLENHFGDLNENQEEMLGAARTAAEAVDADLVALRQIAELDLGEKELRHDRLLPGDLVRSLVPTLQAIADQCSVTLAVDLEPLLPAIIGDQPRLQDALAVLLGGAIREANAGAEVRLSVSRAEDHIRITIDDGGDANTDLRTLLATRTIVASNGTVSTAPRSLTIDFPH